MQSFENKINFADPKPNIVKTHKIKISALCIITALYIISDSKANAANKADADTLSGHFSEIIVTGSNSAVGRNLIPYTVSVIGERELEESGANQLLNAISGMVPSLFVTERGPMGFGVSNGGSGAIKLRGVGGDGGGSVLMMVDGQPQFAGIYSHHIADFYSKDYVERVEVLRGPGSVLYGSNAMGGVINVITRNALRQGYTASLSSRYGSYNTWLTSADFDGRFGAFSATANVSYDRTDGNLKGMLYKQWDGYIKTAYDFSDRWKIALDVTLMNFKGNDPVYPKLSDPESTDIYRQNVTRGETSAVVFNRYASTSGAARLYYSWGNHFVSDPRYFHSVDDRFGALLYQNVALRLGTDITVGFDFNTYSGKIPYSGGKPHTQGSLSTLDRKHIVEYSPYLTAAQPFFDGQMIVSAGLRMANSDMFGTQWVPQVGIVVNPAHLLNIKLSAAKGYRNPSFKELYLYKMANPDLKPENMWNYEISVGKRFSRFISVDLTGYYSRGSNLIQVVDMKNENTGHFINKGVEVSASSHPVEQLHLAASYSWLHTSLDNLTGAPVNQYYLGLDWQVLKSLRVSAELKGVGGLYVADDIKRQNYAIVNLRVNYDLSPLLALFINLNNITDACYEINRGYTMPGFNVLGGFKLTFSNRR